MNPTPSHAVSQKHRECAEEIVKADMYCIEELGEILAKHFPDVAPVAWQKIESAPKDGTHVLVTDGTNMTVAHWFVDGFWLSWNEHEQDAGWCMESITHYMPLPEPPEL